MGGIPILIIKEGAQRIIGKDARRNNIMDVISAKAPERMGAPPTPSPEEEMPEY